MKDLSIYFCVEFAQLSNPLFRKFIAPLSLELHKEMCNYRSKSPLILVVFWDKNW